MNKTTEALKLAEALENDAKEHREVSYGLDCPPERTANWKHALNCEAAARLIREALAEPDIEEMTLTQIASRHEPVKQEPVAWGCRFQDGSINDCICPEEHNRCEGDYNIPLYAAPVKREWVDLTDDEIVQMWNDYQGFGVWVGEYSEIAYDIIAKFKSKNTPPVVPQEPVAWGCRFQDGSINDCICPEEHNRCEGDYNIPLYAAPVKREWVDLTDDEIVQMWNDYQGFGVRVGEYSEIAYDIIAKFKSKNTPPVVPQEPVAWWNGKETAWFEHELCGWQAPDGCTIPLYAAPVSTEAIRSEALEEAAKVCRTAQAKGLQSIREAIEAAIRGLK